MRKVKIFMAYKKRHEILKADTITPIRVWLAIADEVFEEKIGDDTDGNILKQNSKYSNNIAQPQHIYANIKELDATRISCINIF